MMRRWNFTGFYGSYGKIEEHDEAFDLEIIWNGYVPSEPYRKTYKTLKGCRIALARMLESYRMTECK